MRKINAVLLSVTAAALVATSAPVANAADTGLDVVHDFPSADSTIVGSTGFIDGEQVGYFWSAARGDSVAETFSGPKKIKSAKLALDVPYNGLVTGAFVDWTLSINGKDVGEFTVESGEMGAVNENFRFKKIKGREFDVEIRVTNEVASGEGAITLRYAGAGQHSITLK